MTIEQFYEFLRKEDALKTFLRDLLDIHTSTSGGRKKPSLRTYEFRIKSAIDRDYSPIDRLLLWSTTEKGSSYYSHLDNLLWRLREKEEYDN